MSATEEHRHAAQLLPAYGPWITVGDAEQFFALWRDDAARGAPSPALCRACGCRLIACDPGQQLHPTCDPDLSGRGWSR